MTTRRTGFLVLAGVVILAIIAGMIWFFASRSEAETAERFLDDDTRMGGVEITVGNMDKVRAFYEDAVGLTLRSESEGRVALGSETEDLITLVQEPGWPLSSPSQAGLFHSAILFPTAADLAATLNRLAERAPGQYQGSADHHVSRAFYFGDPEGNGLELYVDYPREDWKWQGSLVQMGSDPLDPTAFIRDNLAPGDSTQAVMGHVHLKVGDAAAAEKFYAGGLGFDVTSRDPDAVFLSAGGYHHHLAANAWNSKGTGIRTKTLGLSVFLVRLASVEQVDAVAERLGSAGIEFTREPDSILVEDPWGNRVKLGV